MGCACFHVPGTVMHTHTHRLVNMAFVHVRWRGTRPGHGNE